MLVFNRNFTWSRATCPWCEDTISLDEDAQRTPRRPRFLLSRFSGGSVEPGSWLCLDQYLSSVNPFNQRDLTFSEDVADAFTGVFVVTGKKFRGLG